MIKHVVICDKCGKEENMQVSWDPQMRERFGLPDGWEYYGAKNEYNLCLQCASDLHSKIESFIYDYMKGKNN